MIQIKRVYDPAKASDGFRVLVDRLWPRGVTKADAALDMWLKDAAPSPELRQWFQHDPARFAEFSDRYRDELANNPAADQLKQLIQHHATVTLVYAAKDPQVNHAQVLKDYLAS